MAIFGPNDQLLELRRLRDKITEQGWTIVALKQEIAALKASAQSPELGAVTKSLQAMDEALVGMDDPFYRFSAVATATRAMRNTIADLAAWAARQEGRE